MEMRATLCLAVRLVSSFLVTYAFFGLTHCLSTIPDVARGPFGFGKAQPSVLATILMQIVPTIWFPFVATPFVFWAVDSTLRVTSLKRLQGVVAAISLLIGSAALVLRELLLLHATYAVGSAPATAFTIILNLFVLSALAGSQMDFHTREARPV